MAPSLLALIVVCDREGEHNDYSFISIQTMQKPLSFSMLESIDSLMIVVVSCALPKAGDKISTMSLLRLDFVGLDAILKQGATQRR